MFLWESIAFGPIHSRRLGSSLGINVLPTTEKICSFNCLYCECGWTLEKNIDSTQFYPLQTILDALNTKLKKCSEDKIQIDSITFSGNGEPTLHPDFGEIIDGLILIRDRYYPRIPITCLSNSTQLYKESIRKALNKIENPILKLDAGTEELFQLINRPILPISLTDVISHLKNFKQNLIIQTLFLKGIIDGIKFDNTDEANLEKWLFCIKEIAPKKVMLYSLDRETPANYLIKISKPQLEIIAERVKKMGILTEVY